MAQPEYSQKSINLSEFSITLETGFLPQQPPPTALQGKYFADWERIFSSLPELIKSKTLRNEIDSLPETDFDHSTLRSYTDWHRAYILLSYLGQGYVWMDGEIGLVDKVPRKIAIPWVAVSDHLELKPVGTYATFVLYNLGLHNPAAPMDMSNMYALQTFTGARDESWFFMVHCRVEMAAAPGLNAMARVFHHMAEKDHGGICESLKTVQEALKNMQKEASKMYEGCNPAAFKSFRHFFAGFKNLDAFPNGIIYEGVDENPREYCGASGSQSTTVYAFDVFLGTKYLIQTNSEFIMGMRDYMPKRHREFLRELEKMPSVRDFCKNSGDAELITCYNEAVKELVQFRNNHIILVTRYIVNQSGHTPSLSERGTGGTEFRFLKETRDDTNSLLLKLP